MRRAIVTGSSGFVGSTLLPRLHVPAHALRLGERDWAERLDATDFAGATIFHLAARVHRMTADADTRYHEDNVEKTRRLAEAAAAKGASRIVFLSSVKVHGEETIPGRPLRPGDSMHPQDAYARSKRDAEAALREIASRTGISVCVVRAPLVYGERVRGNLRALARLSDSGWPLPFAAIPNRRSFVHVDDLAGLLVACGESAKAHGATYLAAHEHAISTTELVAGLRRALGRPRRLYAVSPRWLEAGAACIGRRGAALRLTRSLEVDASHAREELGWRAEVGPAEAIEQVARGWRTSGNADA